MSFLKQLFRLQQDCVLCDASAFNVLCAACDGELKRVGAGSPSCPVCAARTSVAEVCGACLREPPQFDATTAAFDYAFPLDRLVQSFKFNANLALVDFFADAIAARIAKDSVDMIVAVPLAPNRFAERGFNQSILLASALAKRLRLPVAHAAMLRIRETPPQTGLTRKDRKKNIKGAFDSRALPANARVAIVDDVMTTGATLSEAARVLKRAGASRVEAWVIARAAYERKANAGESAT